MMPRDASLSEGCTPETSFSQSGNISSVVKWLILSATQSKNKRTYSNSHGAYAYALFKTFFSSTMTVIN